MARAPSTTEQGLGHHWRKVRATILYRDRYRCHWCGGRASQVDHLKPRAEGGARYDPANLVAACAPCNLSRGGKLGAERSRARGGLPPVNEKRPRKVWAGAIRL
jgi:5-methylcytosine-specific restriction endonuclease McrA